MSEPSRYALDVARRWATERWGAAPAGPPTDMLLSLAHLIDRQRELAKDDERIARSFRDRGLCAEVYSYHKCGWIGPDEAPHNATTVCSKPHGHAGKHSGEEKT